MKPTRLVLAASLAASAAAFAPPAAARDDDGGAFGHMLALVHTFVRIAAHSETPQESLRAMDEVLSGRNADANRAMMGLFDEMTAELPPRQRDKLAAIGRDLMSIGRRDVRREAQRAPEVASLQARKDLAAMGLRYYDEAQYLDAVRRNDRLAVELFIAGQGVDLAARDFWGRSAPEIAQARGHTELAERLAKSLPAAR